MKVDGAIKGNISGSLSKEILGRFILAVCLYVVLFLVVFCSFPNITLLKCTVELEHNGRVQVFFKSALRDNAFREEYSKHSGEVKEKEKSTAVVRLPDSPVESIRIDPGQSSGNIKLYSIKITSHFAKSHELGPKEIINLFEPGTDNVIMQLAGDHVQITAKAEDPFIVSNKPLMSRPWGLILGIPFPFALFFFFYLEQKSWPKIVLFDNLSEKRPATGCNIDSLDGLRGLAAIMVVADHCWGRFTGLGAGGVLIFMALSGFLLARPFASDPSRIVSLEKIKQFYARRCRRVLPAYYAYIIVVYLLAGRFDIAIKHFLFLQGAGHLWVIPQEIMFYLLIPFVLLGNYLFFRKNWWLSFLATAGMAVAANIYLTTDVFYLYGMLNKKLRLMFGIFLSGAACAYLYEYFRHVQRVPEKYERYFTTFCSSLGSVLLLIMLLGSTARMWGGVKVYAQIYSAWFGLTAALLVLCITFSNGTLLSRFLTWQPLRCLGVVSLSLYLFHPLVIGLLKKGTIHFTGVDISRPILFVSTLALSYFLARFTYFHIEKPFMK